MMKKKMGLLVMAYGTPNKEEDIESYYTHIRQAVHLRLNNWKTFATATRQSAGFLHLRELLKTKQMHFATV